MKKKGVFSLLLICCFLVLTGCFQEAQIKNNNKDDDVTLPQIINPSIIEEKDEKPEVAVSRIDEMVDQMSTAEKVGQIVLIGVEGKTFSSQMDNLIRNYHVGGVIVRGGNVSTVQETLQLINDLKKANKSNKHPLFLSVDEEGGRVSRLPPGLAKLPSSAQIGKRNDVTLSYKAGIYLATVLDEFGYNMNFAPVLDINSNPKNPVIGDRSFGTNPQQVAQLGISTMHGMMDNGVIPVVKHFPGHGDTVVDSHKALPKVESSLDRLQAVELAPFQQAVDEGAEAIMIAHILFPALDPHYPSSMSKVVIKGLLRDEMQFNGVIITDDLAMGAIVNDYSVPEAAVRSFIAGSDLLLVSKDYDNQVNTVSALLNAIQTGEITEQRLNASVKRILTLKLKYDVSDIMKEEVDVVKLNEMYDKLNLSK